MGLSVSEWFICKTKTFHIADRGCPSWHPLLVNTLYLYLLCPHSAPLGGPDLNSQLSELSTQPRQRKMKKERRKQNLIFMVN